MDFESQPDDGYKLHLALEALRTLGSSDGQGWAPIREIWSSIAAGRLCAMDAASWARAIAQRITEDVLDAEPEERARRALKAIGLVGIQRNDWAERRALKLLLDFEGLAVAPENFTGKPIRNGRRKRLLEYMRAHGFYSGCTDMEAMKRIDRLETTIPQAD